MPAGGTPENARATLFAMPPHAQAVRSEAADIIRRIVRLLPLSPTMAAYLVGQADALDPDGADSAECETE
jgi:hypothetical protein